MACNRKDMDSIELSESRAGPDKTDENGTLIKYYRASELIPSPKPLLHNLLKKEPAVWASVQISTGILSVGLGIMFAAVFEIGNLLLTLFRVPIITGLLFLIAGFLSTHLNTNQGLLKVCLRSNIGCLITAAFGTVLLSVDLAKEPKTNYEVELLALCVTLLDMFISSVLIFFIWSEVRKQEKN